MPLSILCSAQVSAVFVLRRPLFFSRLQGLAHSVEDAVRLLVVASLDVTPLLTVAVVAAAAVVVVVVAVILLAGDTILFLHAPALTQTVALAVIALFPSKLSGFRASFLQYVAFSMIPRWRCWVFFCFLGQQMHGRDLDDLVGVFYCSISCINNGLVWVFITRRCG